MQRWEQAYEFTGPGRLDVEQGEGDLRIVGWEKPVVQVKASWSGEGPVEDRLDVEVGPNYLGLAVKPYRSGFLGLLSDSRVDLEIFVPVGTACDLESGSGPVTVASTRGPVTIDGGSGSVQVRQVAGPVRVETGSGHIDLETAAGPVSLEAGSGSIHVSRVASPEMHIETGSGSVRAQALDVKHLFVETGSGSVAVELGRIHPDGRYQVETGSGRVQVAVPEGAGFHLEIDSHGGVDFGGLPVQIVRREDDEISAIVGEGGPQVAIETGSGSITLRTHRGSIASATEVADHPTASAKDDPALEETEQMARILNMVQEGKLSVQEAEELLRALHGEEG
jgi:hypothetical protein